MTSEMHVHRPLISHSCETQFALVLRLAKPMKWFVTVVLSVYLWVRCVSYGMHLCFCGFLVYYFQVSAQQYVSARLSYIYYLTMYLTNGNGRTAKLVNSGTAFRIGIFRWFLFKMSNANLVLIIYVFMLGPMYSNMFAVFIKSYFNNC